MKIQLNGCCREQDASVGIGGYGEIRPFYSTDAYLVDSNEGPTWRTVHLGVDIWMEADTPVYAPMEGEVFAVKNNEGERNYGPTLIIKHTIHEDLTFYTLYGHLSWASIKNLSSGQAIKKGEQIATFGAAPENGNWPPHLHFQLILDMLDYEDDFPGVAFPESKRYLDEHLS